MYVAQGEYGPLTKENNLWTQQSSHASSKISPL